MATNWRRSAHELADERIVNGIQLALRLAAEAIVDPNANPGPYASEIAATLVQALGILDDPRVRKAMNDIKTSGPGAADGQPGPLSNISLPNRPIPNDPADRFAWINAQFNAAVSWSGEVARARTEGETQLTTGGVDILRYQSNVPAYNGIAQLDHAGRVISDLAYAAKQAFATDTAPWHGLDTDISSEHGQVPRVSLGQRVQRVVTIATASVVSGLGAFAVGYMSPLDAPLDVDTILATAGTNLVGSTVAEGVGSTRFLGPADWRAKFIPKDAQIREKAARAADTLSTGLVISGPFIAMATQQVGESMQNAAGATIAALGRAAAWGASMLAIPTRWAAAHLRGTNVNISDGPTAPPPPTAPGPSGPGFI